MAVGNFRFVNKEKTLAICGVLAFGSHSLLKTLKKGNFHVITGFPSIVEKLRGAGVPHSYLDLSIQRKSVEGNAEATATLKNEIDTQLKSGSKVLLHCFAGKTFSPNVAAAYLIASGYTPQEAANAVTHKTASAAEREVILQNAVDRVKKYQEHVESKRRAQK